MSVMNLLYSLRNALLVWCSTLSLLKVFESTIPVGVCYKNGSIP
jgi:hypothetical protein